MSDRLRRIVAQVFDVPEGSVTDESGPETVESWDSLTHLNLVLALEEEFGVQFTPDDAMKMVSIGAVRAALREQGVAVA